MNHIIDEHLGFWNQIFKLAKADIIKTYKGAALGWLWAIIKPVITILVYWFVFTIGLKGSHQINNHPFWIWLVVGIIPWFYISEVLTQGTDAIRKYSYLVTKMNFPVSTIPTFVNISKLIIHLIMLLITIVILWIQGYPPSIYYLQLPLYIILMFLFFTMWSLFAAPLAAISKDFSNLIKSFITVLFWLSGIIYDPHTINIRWIKTLLLINPVTFLAEGYRNTLIFKVWFFENIWSLLGFMIIFWIMILLSLTIYQRLRKEIPDVL